MQSQTRIEYRFERMIVKFTFGLSNPEAILCSKKLIYSGCKGFQHVTNLSHFIVLRQADSW